MTTPKPRGRKTKPITYNLHDRGWKHNGPDRSNVDMQSMIRLINSSGVQELVDEGKLWGYCGHNIRQRYGMRPPEAIVIEGKMVYLAPAFKTIEIKAHANGDVTHRAEFTTNEAGEWAREQYLAQVGGFSTAVNFKQFTMPKQVSGFFGFDYVLQPNYTTNVGDGQLYDGLFLPEDVSADSGVACFDSLTNVEQLDPANAQIARMLEQQILSDMQNINAQLGLLQHAERAYDHIEAMAQQEARREQRENLQAQRQAELYTGMVGEIRSFDSVCAEADELLQRAINPYDTRTRTEPAKKKPRLFSFGMRS
ncbi:hypothetical protein [Alkanindiges illinoisensis]|uniref:hypothetical protein n=1 Tax=Alkanindiges illinoisensis TaxID=197183 RepID=UPI00047EDE62|nr:hypothetical protein [Alkanindiges illinoisensis]